MSMSPGSVGLSLLVDRTAFADEMEMALAVSETAAAPSSKAAAGAEEAAVAAGVDDPAQLRPATDGSFRTAMAVFGFLPDLEKMAGEADAGSWRWMWGFDAGDGLMPDLKKTLPARCLLDFGRPELQISANGETSPLNGSDPPSDNGRRAGVSPARRQPWPRLAEEDEAPDTVL
ncbi:hypothetical protein ACLOJK_003403 [Asimina triloba]